jgi:hypothetical protein
MGAFCSKPTTFSTSSTNSYGQVCVTYAVDCVLYELLVPHTGMYVLGLLITPVHLSCVLRLQAKYKNALTRGDDDATLRLLWNEFKASVNTAAELTARYAA